MSATVLYAVLLVVLMTFITGCSRASPERERARTACRGAAVGKRAVPWTPPRGRL